MRADTVFINGEIITVDQNDRIVECVAVKGNRIIATGLYEEVSEFITDETVFVNLEGKTLLPGFIDAHCHLTIYGTNFLGVDCVSSNIQSLEELFQELRKKVEMTPEGQWVRISAFNELLMKEKRYPTREELDEISTKHPIIVIRYCNHYSFVNSKALEVAKIDENTKDPVGGIIERDEGGHITGKLIENSHMSILEFAKYTDSELLQGLKLASGAFIKEGVTSVHDLGAYGDGADNFRVMQEFINSAEEKVRIYATVGSLTNAHLFIKKMVESGVVTGLGNEWFRVGPAKLFIDGASVGPTMSTREGYSHDPENHGLLYYSQEEIDSILGEAHKNGFQITSHAQGDKAIEMLLNCIDKALKEHPRDNHRHRIEHGGIVSPDLLQRIKELGVIPIPNPVFMYLNGDKYREFYGDRVNVMYPSREYIDNGIISAFGSDTPVNTVNPLLGIHAAVNRQGWNGEFVGENQQINVLEAIRSYTLNGAYASFEEEIKGSIEVGKLADFVVLNKSILNCEKTEIKDLSVTLTMIDGEILYDRDNISKKVHTQSLM